MTRRSLILLTLLTLLIAAGCTAEPVALPTRAVLPSPTLAVQQPVSAAALPTETSTPAPSAAEPPTLTASPPPTVTASATPTVTPSPSPSDTPTVTSTFTVTPTLTITETPRGWYTVVPTDTPPPTETPLPTTPAPEAAAGVMLPTPLITAIRLAPAASVTPIPSETPVPSETPTPTLTPTFAGTPIGEASVTAANALLVNLMSEPSLTARPIIALANGENLFVIGRSWNNEWIQVRTMNGVEGWVYRLYLVIWQDLSRVVVTHLEPTRPPYASVGTFALGGHVMTMEEATYSVMRQAGMNWLKIQHRYYHGESGSAAAPLINAAHRAGFRIVVGVVGDRAQLASVPGYHQAFASFVAGVAAAGADAIEIWNEPNIDREWPQGFIHGGNYVDLLRPAYTAIKAVNPATIVISAAPAPTGFFGPAGCGEGGCNDDIYLKQMAYAGAQNYLDCVGLHHNDGIVSPTQMSGDPRGSHPTYFLRGVISRVPPEFNSRPICFTEVGYLSPQGMGGPLPPNFAWANNTSVSQHAQWLGEAVRIARSTGRVQMFIVWNVDFDVYRYDDPMAGYAIRRPDGSCPACATLAEAMR